MLYILDVPIQGCSQDFRKGGAKFFAPETTPANYHPEALPQSFGHVVA